MCYTIKLWVPVAHISILKMKGGNKWAVTLFINWTDCKRKWLMPHGCREALQWQVSELLSKADAFSGWLLLPLLLRLTWRTLQNVSDLLSGLVNFVSTLSLKHTQFFKNVQCLLKICLSGDMSDRTFGPQWHKKIVSNQHYEYTRLPDSSTGLSLVPVLLFYIH